MLKSRRLVKIARIMAVGSVTAVAAIALSLGVGGGAGPARAQTSTINMLDNSFNPATVTIAPGATIEWFNTGVAPHTATSETGLWDSGLLNTNGRFTRQFTEVGTFRYKCTLHPEMTGTITVQASSGTSTPTTTPTSTATSAPAATATPAATSPAALTQPGTGRWVDRPPSAPGAAQSCPASNQWLLLYWSGGDNTAIGTAAGACASADLFWVSREGKWLGYSSKAPAASDTWNVLNGEAHFIHAP